MVVQARQLAMFGWDSPQLLSMLEVPTADDAGDAMRPDDGDDDAADDDDGAIRTTKQPRYAQVPVQLHAHRRMRYQLGQRGGAAKPLDKQMSTPLPCEMQRFPGWSTSPS